jgi:hypothetical protein
MGLFLWTLDKIVERQQKRRRVKVLVHEAVFLGRDPATGKAIGSEPHYFVKVTNLSETREIELTHVWVDGNPQVHLMNPARPLPARLRLDETWEGWVPAAQVAHVANVERAFRVRLSSTQVIKSRRNKDVPPVGYVGGLVASSALAQPGTPGCWAGDLAFLWSPGS